MLIFIVTKFGADWFISADARELTKSTVAIFPNSRANNSSCCGPIGPMIEFIQILLDINILTKFGADWSIFANDRLCVNKVKYNNLFFFFFFDKGKITLTILSGLD